jgi:tetratricopeptide (TPR) repeat protein
MPHTVHRYGVLREMTMRFTSATPMLSIGLSMLFGLGLIAGAEAGGDKVPITTSSKDAKQTYLEGREFQDNLRFTDAREQYMKAIQQDERFALAHLGLANTSTTAIEFFDALERAVATSEGTSEGERMMILGFQAGVNSQPDEQEGYLTKLVEAYPNDERAHTLLANVYFGRQQYDRAIGHYQKATAISPDFSPPYNNLGYAYRFTYDYENAEKAFQKYIQLLPNEPNPYDSYAEFLMKVGRFEESIEQYRKALEVNEHFMASYVGIGLNEVLLGKGDAARKTYEEMHGKARTVAEERQALFQMAVSYVYEGRHDEALAQIQKQYNLAKATEDLATMSGDVITMGNILLEAGRPDEALAKFQAGVKYGDKADRPEEVKEATRRNYHYNAARVALAQGNLDQAKAEAATYREQVAMHNVPFEVRLTHQMDGRIALAEKNYAGAIEHLQQAGTQNPRIHYWLAEAYYGEKKTDSAHKHCEMAANFNGLGMNYAYVRTDAQKMLSQASAGSDY